jgi:hypothetical protein
MEKALATVNDGSPFIVAEEAKEPEKQEDDQSEAVEESKEEIHLTKEVMFDEDVSVRSQDDFSDADLEDAGLTPPRLLH